MKWKRQIDKRQYECNNTYQAYEKLTSEARVASSRSSIVPKSLWENQK